MKLIRETVEQVKYLTETTENGKKNLFIPNGRCEEFIQKVGSSYRD